MDSPHATIRPSVAGIVERPHAEVLVIGGGINGIATFRDLAVQGVDVVLVERDDWSSGASSASSHMIHGGIRYLENGEFRLVRESVHERNALLRLAPHYVKPLQTTIPIFSLFSGILAAPLRFLRHRGGKPQERGAVLIKLGLTIYDTFSRGSRAVPRHTFLGRKAALADLPALNPDVRYTATYFDAAMHDPERLALDALHDGLRIGEHARAANYLEAVALGADGVRLRDAATGTEFAVHADLVINATGPWTDLTNGRLGTATAYTGGTKGSHIVLRNDELLAATRGREIFFEHSDGRIVLIYPLKGRVMVGTTDIDADPSVPARCTEEEVDYFLDLIGHVFPSIPVDRSEIVYRFSGIRPLPRHEDTQPGFVSRDYRVVAGELEDGTPLLSLVGGKWTTFRALGEHLATEALALLGRKRTQSTAELPIGGGAGFPTTPAAREDWLRRHGGALSAERAGVLLDRYGTNAAELITAIGADAPLPSAPGYSLAELEQLARTEDVVHLDDLVLRRTSLAFTGAATLDAIHDFAAAAATGLGWSAERRDEEIDRLLALLADAHGLELRKPAERPSAP